MKKKKGDSEYFRFFKVGGEDREFMYRITEKHKRDLEPHKKAVKKQGDIYRTTKTKRGYTLWDARP